MQNNHSRQPEGVGPLFGGASFESGTQSVRGRGVHETSHSTSRRRDRSNPRHRDGDDSTDGDHRTARPDASDPTSHATPPAHTTQPCTPPRTVRRKLQEIRPHPLARGFVDPRHVARLKQDIQEHGQRTPISVTRDPTGHLVIEDGHHRAAAMAELGLTEISVIVRPYPPSDPAAIRALTSELSRRRSAAERTALLLRGVSELASASKLEATLSAHPATSRRGALARALGVNENMAGKLLTIAESGAAELVERFASTPLNTARLETLYQLAQAPHDVQSAVLRVVGDDLFYVIPNDVQALRRLLTQEADVREVVQAWGARVIGQLETAHADAASKAVARVLSYVERLSARLQRPARSRFAKELAGRLAPRETSSPGGDPAVAGTGGEF